MINSIVFSLIELAALVSMMGICDIFLKERVNYKWFGLTLGLFVIYRFAYFGRHIYDIAFFEQSRWYWSSAIYASIVLLIIFAFMSKPLRSEVGLRLRQTRGLRFTWIGVGLYFAFFLVLAIINAPLGFQGDWDHLAFQLIMPTFNEELFYRGIFLVFLDRTFGFSRKIFGFPMGWGAIISSVMFGVPHGLSVAGGISVDWLAVFIPGAIGLVGCWLKVKTGSLLVPMLMHSHGNAIDIII